MVSHRTIVLNMALFPPLEYMALLLFHPDVMIEAHENYGKQSYRNRFYIMGPNGKQMLHVPVNKTGMQHCPVQEARLSNPDHWRHIHLRSLETAYSNAPWYLHFKDDLEDFYRQVPTHLWDLGINSIQLSASLLGKPCHLRFTASFTGTESNFLDLRNRIHPKCKNQPWPPSNHEDTYHQVFAERFGFMPGLSILDLIFNEGPLALSWLKGYYDAQRDTIST